MNARALVILSVALSGCVIAEGGDDTAIVAADGGTIDAADDAILVDNETSIDEDTGPIVLDSASPPDTTKPEVVDTGPDDTVKKVLPFVWKGQETGYWCGPGSTRIALSTRLSTLPSQTTLAKYMGTTTAGTDYVGLVVNALNHYFPTTRFKSKAMYDPPTAAQRTALKADILANIRAGYGMVANVVSGWRPPGYPSGTIYHYVAIVGFDAGGDKVLIADPAAEGSAGAGWTKVPRTYWVSVYDLGTWIGGKGYTGQ